MKRVLTLVAGIFIMLPVFSQLNEPSLQSYHYLVPGMHLTLSNSFLKSKHKFTPTQISLPYVEESIICYGPVVKLSAFETDKDTRLKEYSGSFFRYKGPEIAPFTLNELQVSLSLNGTLIEPLHTFSSSPAFQDTFIYRADRKPAQSNYLVVNDSIEIGDTLLIKIETTDNQPVLTIKIRRENARTQPFMALYQNNAETNGTGFIRHQFSQWDRYTEIAKSYAYWPGQGMSLKNREFPTGTNLAFYFRPEPLNGSDSVFLYRLFASGDADTSWKRSDFLVMALSLEQNKRYQLEVKFADGHGDISRYSFRTPSYWYQTLAFRIGLGAAVAGLVVVGWLLYSYRRNRRKLQQYGLEMRSLYAQLNPHFIFNAMSSIQGLMNDGKIEKANTYLAGFAGLLRRTITFPAKEWILLREELRTIETYISLERLRFGFAYHQEIKEDLPMDIEVPPLLAQPLIENAVKHGIAGQGINGELTLKIWREEEDILFLIRDNGAGFETKTTADGQGLPLTRQRISLFNKMYRRIKIEMKIEQKADGTYCLIRYKKWLEK